MNSVFGGDEISAQIGEIQSSTAESATAIDAIADTIKRMNEIASKIAVSVADDTTHTYYATATDAANNTSLCSSDSVTSTGL